MTKTGKLALISSLRLVYDFWRNFSLTWTTPKQQFRHGNSTRNLVAELTSAWQPGLRTKYFHIIFPNTCESHNLTIPALGNLTIAQSQHLRISQSHNPSTWESHNRAIPALPALGDLRIAQSQSLESHSHTIPTLVRTTLGPSGRKQERFFSLPDYI